MNRIDYTAPILALLMGFVLSAGMVGFILSAGGYQLPTLGATPPGMMAGPGMPMAGTAPAAVAPAVKPQAPAAAGATVAPEAKIVATDLKFTPQVIQAKVGQPIKISMENKGVIEHDL